MVAALLHERKPVTPSRLLIIANPISGGGRSRTLAPVLQRELQARGLDAELWFTRCAGDAAARATQAATEGWSGLIAVGGDGTVNEVIGGMPDPSLPIGTLPVGTANVLACELRLPARPAAAADVIARGHTRSLAIGIADGRRFLLFVGCGVDGSVVERLSAVRTGTLGKHKWVGPILHTVRNWPNWRLRATFADGEVLEDLSSVLVTRVRNYGGVMRLTPGVNPDDGLLHVHCFRMRSRAAWAWHGLRAVLRQLRPGRHLAVRTTRSLRIDGDPAPWQIDGDLGGRGPIAVSLHEKQARVFAPPV
jgi:diacylglycerol kinase (ATP)